MGDVHRATAAISDAAKRIGRYLLMQLVVNVLYGLPIGVGLFLIGVPNALLWGVLSTVLRFIPYLGPILAAMFPIALSFAIDSGWTTPMLTVALFIAVELFISNVLEPWLYGSSTGLSPWRSSSPRCSGPPCGDRSGCCWRRRLPYVSSCWVATCRSCSSSRFCSATSRCWHRRSSSTSAS